MRSVETIRPRLFFRRAARIFFRAVGVVRFSSGIPILCYHSIDNSLSRYLSISERKFAEQILFLKNKGYRTISLADLAEGNVGGHGREIAKTVVITFDDGFRNNYTSAFPILEKAGFKATFFLATNYIDCEAEWLRGYLNQLIRDFEGMDQDDLAHIRRDQLRMEFAEKRASFLLSLSEEELRRELLNLYRSSKKPMLRWKEILEMSHSGMEFGTHTLSHPFLSDLPGREVEEEIVQSGKEIERRTGKPVRFLCYPYGDYTETVKKTVKRAGFTGACSLEVGHCRLPVNDSFVLPRIPGDFASSLPVFSFFLSNGCDPYFSFKNFLLRFGEKSRWMN